MTAEATPAPAPDPDPVPAPQSAAPPAPPDTLRITPRRLRRICFGGAGVLVVFFAVMALALPSSGSDQIATTTSGAASFGVADKIAIFGIGVAVAGGLLWLARPRVVAGPDGLAIRNLVGHYQVPWELVRAVSFRDGSPWAALELDADEQIPLMAVQAADGERTVTTVRALRAMHREATRAGATTDRG